MPAGFKIKGKGTLPAGMLEGGKNANRNDHMLYIFLSMGSSGHSFCFQIFSDIDTGRNDRLWAISKGIVKYRSYVNPGGIQQWCRAHLFGDRDG